MKLENVLLALQDYLLMNNPDDRDIPIGITISFSGEYFCVKYSLGSSSYYSSLPGAIKQIEDFLKQENYL